MYFRLLAICVIGMLHLAGCSSSHVKTASDPSAGATIQIEVEDAETHLGHNINESNGHSVWCDGCRARLLTSGEPFVIYWINNAIKDSNYRFAKGEKYEVVFSGDIETGVMGYEGKCIELGQITEIKSL
jgi:hypothetical protein